MFFNFSYLWYILNQKLLTNKTIWKLFFFSIYQKISIYLPNSIFQLNWMKFASNLIYFIKFQKIRINSKKEVNFLNYFFKKWCNFFIKLVGDVYLDFLHNYLMSMFAVYKSLIHNIYTCSYFLLHLHMGCGGRLGCLSMLQMSLTELYNTLLRSTYRSTLFF